jgi:hypothetical protein
VERLEDDRIPEQIFMYDLKGRQGVTRPRKRWIEAGTGHKPIRKVNLLLLAAAAVVKLAAVSYFWEELVT